MTNDARKEYLRNYQREWMRARRRAILKQLGPCAGCGSNRNIQIDHKNPSSKAAAIRKQRTATFWSWSMARIQKELKKCQPLCATCHKKKTAAEIKARRPAHGIAEYRHGCRCEVCREANRTRVNALRIRRWGTTSSKPPKGHALSPKNKH